MRPRSTPAWRARLAVASSSRAIVPIGSCIGGIFAQLSGQPAHVIQNQAGISHGGHFSEVRIEGQAAGIVEDLDAVLQRSLGDFRFISIERERGSQISSQAFQNGNQPLPLLVRADSLRSRLRRFRPDVDDVGPLFLQFQRPRVSPIGIVEAAAVREGIGRNVQNAHDERALAQLHFRVAQLPIVDFSIHY